MSSLGQAVPVITPAPAGSTAITSDNPGAAAASRVVKNSAGKAFRLTMSNGNVAARFFQVFDANAVPADTAVPLISVTVPIGGSVTLDFGIYGRSFANGIVVCNSTTQLTKTIGAADSLFDSSFL